MIRFPRSRMARAAAAVALVCYLPTCTSWHVQQITPSQVITTKQPKEIRILRRDSTRVELLQPTLVGDSIVGVTRYPAGLPPPGTPPSRSPLPVSPPVHMAVALADVQSLESREPDGGKTALLVAGITLPIVLLAVAAASSPTSCTSDTTIHL